MLWKDSCHQGDVTTSTILQGCFKGQESSNILLGHLQRQPVNFFRIPPRTRVDRSAKHGRERPPIAAKIVDMSQTAFNKGPIIIEGVLCLNEIMHELERTKMLAIILKLEFEKTYDRVSWSFLSEVLHRKGFIPAFMHIFL